MNSQTINPFLVSDEIFEFELYGTFKYKRSRVSDILNIDQDLFIVNDNFNLRLYNIAKIASGLFEVPWLREHINEAIKVDKEWKDLDLKERMILLQMLPNTDGDIITTEIEKFENSDLKKK